MAEVLVRFTEQVLDANGNAYDAQACGAVADDGLWEGWIEFVNAEGAIRTGRETEQPNTDDLKYWAQGLTMVYLQGALARALSEPVAPLRTQVAGTPRFDASRPRPVQRDVAIEPRAILDPFKVYGEGEHILRQQLRALSRDQVANIAASIGLDGTSGKENRVEIEERIVAAAQSRVARRDRAENTDAHQSL
jgi:hypothetical protein